MQSFRSICRLEKKLWHFENFDFFWNIKFTKHRITKDAGSTRNNLQLVLFTIPPSFIEIRSLTAKFGPKSYPWGSESQMWPLNKNSKILYSYGFEIHLNKEGECFAPLLPFGKVPQVFDDLSHGVHDFFVEGPETLTRGTLLAIYFWGHSVRKHRNTSREAAQRQIYIKNIYKK